MKIFAVGGAVRDVLMGMSPKDRDYVVVGATAQEMLDLGYTPVGKDFPVFLHPKTHEEYALARLDRKTGAGYGGFSFSTKDVTLEEDLSRRDLTINSMALTESGDVIDPFGGQRDLSDKVIRHTTAAFSEDPVRVLRVARFMARFGPEWSVAPETLSLMRQMVAAGELDSLTEERVWKEFEKGLAEPYPTLMLGLLDHVSALPRQPFREYRYFDDAAPSRLQEAVARGESLPVKFAVAFTRRWSNEERKASRVPSDVREVADSVARLFEAVAGQFSNASASAQLDALLSVDALRQRQRFEAVVRAYGYFHPEDAAALESAARRVGGVDPSKVIQPGSKGPEVQAQIRDARIRALTESVV